VQSDQYSVTSLSFTENVAATLVLVDRLWPHCTKRIWAGSMTSPASLASLQAILSVVSVVAAGRVYFAYLLPVTDVPRHSV
jgi:hypothetical protein